MALDLVQVPSISTNFDLSNKHILHGNGDNNSIAHKQIRTRRRSTLKELFEKESNTNNNPSSPNSLENSMASSSSETILMKKIDICKVCSQDDDNGREFKIKTLLEILEFVKLAKHCKQLPHSIVKELFAMISCNIFRDFDSENKKLRAININPPELYQALDVQEDENVMLDPSWPHLQIVYDIILNLLASTQTDPKSLARGSCLDKPFILGLLDLFESEDPREREVLKAIVHRIYEKFTFFRCFMRKSFNNILFRFIFETEKHSGIAEILEVLGSIIHGFAVPLREEHKLFLSRVLMPLHKPKCLNAYHPQLQYCVSQFVHKDSKLAGVVIRGLLSYWPLTNYQKEMLFLGELEEVLEAMEEPEFKKFAVPLSRQLSRSLNSYHSQVAERALYIWNNERFLDLVSRHMEQIVPAVVSGMEKNLRDHWNKSIQEQTLYVKKMLEELDPQLFDECMRKFEEEESKAEHVRRKRELIWKQLESLAARAGTDQPIYKTSGYQSSSMPMKVVQTPLSVVY